MAQVVDNRSWRDAEPVEVPSTILTPLREICDRLPDAQHDGSSYGARWRIRKRTFLAVRTRLVDGVPATRLQFRSPDPELEFLIGSGPPFARAGWGSDVVNMYLLTPHDWAEVAELVTESYCVLAPKRLAALARDNALADSHDRRR